MKLTPIERVQQDFPDWPYSSWSTARLIREKKLGCVRVGRRVFVTEGLISAFVARHTEAPADPVSRRRAGGAR